MQITIIGLGLVGSSLGMAWRQGTTGCEIVGHDISNEAAQKAQRKGAVDRTEWNLPASVEKADVVVLATPVSAMKDILGHIADCLPARCIVTDTGSTKREVVAWAETILPPHIAFVGGNPAVSKDASDIDGARADLFAGGSYCVTPSVNATPEAVDLICKLIGAAGAAPYFLDPAEHDGLVAAVDHLPLLASTALVRATTASRSWREMSRLAAAAFRDVSSLAAGDPSTLAGVCRTNRENVVRWLDAYVAELVALRKLVEADDEGLDAAFGEAKAARDRWLAGEGAERAVKVEIPTFGGQVRQGFFGGGGKLFTRGRDKDKGKSEKTDS